MASITPTATAVAADHCQLRATTLQIAQTARMGALIMTCRPIEMTICTCWMSLVVRVIRLAVEKRLISSIEYPCTRSNTRERRRKDTAAAMRATKKPTTTEETALPSAQASISPPFFQISPPAPVPDTASTVIFSI